jgi:hypothetical protein
MASLVSREESVMRGRIGVAAVMAIVGLALVLPGRQAEGRTRAASGSWELAATVYPSHTQIKNLPATNANADRFFGRFRKNFYGELNRLDGQGWLQFATLTRTSGRAKHTLMWAYLVSYYPAESDAIGALDTLLFTGTSLGLGDQSVGETFIAGRKSWFYTGVRRETQGEHPRRDRQQCDEPRPREPLTPGAASGSWSRSTEVSG